MNHPLPRAPQLRSSWRWSSLLLICLTWGILQVGGLFSPGLLDDVDSVYLEIAREMLQRHDFVTPTVDGIRFFDKPPLMYWMAAGSMRVFGQHDWAARLPLALGVLLLLLAVYALGIRLFRGVSPSSAPDRGGLYAALATGICLGTYLYTRFYIPDILIALWMTLSVHLLLLALHRLSEGRSTLVPSLGFAVALALNVLTKGLIGLVFPLGFVVLYLLWTKQLSALRGMHIPEATALFLVLAAPWHILAALRNPPIPMPPGLGLPQHAGWAWFYFYNEHIARFLQKRIPHDYGQVPVPLFWLLLFVWLVPWTGFVVPAIGNAVRALKNPAEAASQPVSPSETTTPNRRTEAARALLLWAGLILGFFTLSSRQEYYHLPALPALALLAGGLLARADTEQETAGAAEGSERARSPHGADRQALAASRWFLIPLGTALGLLCGFFALTAPKPASGATLSSLLNSNPALYTLSLGHVFDLTGRAMGLFRLPLTTVALSMFFLGPGSHLVRRNGKTLAANLLVAGAMTGVLLGAHEGLARFYPILGSRELALAIEQQRRPGDLVAIDGELTAGSTLLFYGQTPVYLVNGRVNGPWFGSFWPDAPQLFWNDAKLARIWASSKRVFLLTYHPEERTPELNRFGPVHTVAVSGGKTILSNR